MSAVDIMLTRRQIYANYLAEATAASIIIPSAIVSCKHGCRMSNVPLRVTHPMTSYRMLNNSRSQAVTRYIRTENIPSRSRCRNSDNRSSNIHSFIIKYCQSSVQHANQQPLHNNNNNNNNNNNFTVYYC